MADYREHYRQIQATGASVAAVSVDAPEKSKAVGQELHLPFPILCDTERRVIQEWDIYNPRERGGIAKPAVFVIERDRRVRYGAVDSVSTRVPPSEIVRVLQTAKRHAARRKLYIPRFAEWLRAIRNSARREESDSFDAEGPPCYLEVITRLLPAAKAVVTGWCQPIGQYGEGLVTRPTDSTPHPNALVLVIMALTQSPSAADDRVVQANGTSPR